METEMRNKVAIVIHGGAGMTSLKDFSDEHQIAHKKVLEEAVTVGHEMLLAGQSALLAVESAIRVLEDSPLFNAGRGAVFTNEGHNHLDAAIMDGNTQNAGSVASVSRIKNPISLAKKILEESQHVMLSGEGAIRFAENHGFELCSPQYFYVEERHRQLIKARERDVILLDHEDEEPLDSLGTVGAVALDANGNLAAGTSTGGMTNKKHGRIGDTPIIGSGTYAENGAAAVSCTGYGEFFMRNVTAYDTVAMLKYGKLDLESAANKAIHEKIKGLGGRGGLIVMDAEGNIFAPFNTQLMFRAWIDVHGKKFAGIY